MSQTTCTLNGLWTHSHRPWYMSICQLVFVAEAGQLVEISQAERNVTELRIRRSTCSPDCITVNDRQRFLSACTKSTATSSAVPCFSSRGSLK